MGFKKVSLLVHMFHNYVLLAVHILVQREGVRLIAVKAEDITSSSTSLPLLLYQCALPPTQRDNI